MAQNQDRSYNLGSPFRGAGVILAIESSCDETSAAVSRDGKILSNIIANHGSALLFNHADHLDFFPPHLQ